MAATKTAVTEHHLPISAVLVTDILNSIQPLYNHLHNGEDGALRPAIRGGCLSCELMARQVNAWIEDHRA